jgi:hypothetical protein
MSKTTKGNPPEFNSSFTAKGYGGTPDPLGVAVVAYAAGPLPGTYLYAGPFEPQPWSPGPTNPTLPSTTLTLTSPCNHTAEFKRIEEHLARIAALLEQVIAGLKVREVATEMLEAVRTRGKGGKKK